MAMEINESMIGIYNNGIEDVDVAQTQLV